MRKKRIYRNLASFALILFVAERKWRRKGAAWLLLCNAWILGEERTARSWSCLIRIRWTQRRRKRAAWLMPIDICCHVYIDFGIFSCGQVGYFVSRIHTGIRLNFVVECAYLNVIVIASSVWGTWKLISTLWTQLGNESFTLSARWIHSFLWANCIVRHIYINEIFLPSCFSKSSFWNTYLPFS
jgi:hypothetical protein